MLARMLIGAALLFQAGAPLKWVGDVFSPGEKVTYAHPHPHLRDGDYTLTLADEDGKETEIPAKVVSHVLVFACPPLHDGFYEIAGARNERSGSLYYGHINGQQGFYIERR